MQPTPEQLQLVAEFQALTEQERRIYFRSLFAENPQEFLRQLSPNDAYAIQNGQIGQIIGSALLTGLTGGLWAGVAAFVAGTAQLLLTPPQQQQQRQADPRFASRYSGSIGNTLARRGDPIPAIFCSRSKDPTGGVQTPGLMTHYRIETIDGNQKAYSLFVISHGVLGQIDLSRTLINNQPISNFAGSAISQDWKNGAAGQVGFADYPFYSQNITPRDNNGAGLGLVTNATTGVNAIAVNNIVGLTVGTEYYFDTGVGSQISFKFTLLGITGSTLLYSGLPPIVSGITVRLISNGNGVAITTGASYVSSSFLVLSDDIQSYGNGKELLIIPPSGVSYKARITNRNQVLLNIGAGITNYDLITTDSFAGWINGSVIYTNDRAIYRTSKRVNRIDLNLSLQVWARNDKGELIEHAAIYLINIRQYGTATFIPVAQIAQKSKNPATLLRGIEINNLALAVYDVEIIPVQNFVPGIRLLELLDYGDFNSYLSAWGNVKVQGYEVLTTFAAFNALADLSKSRTPDNSGNQGITLRIGSVNEIEYTTAVGKVRNTNYEGLAIARFECQFNEQLSQGASVTWFVTEGIITHKLLLAGTADIGSTTGTLSYLPGFGAIPLTPGLLVRNTSKRTEAVATGIGPSGIGVPGLVFEEGDTFLLKESHSTCWWPEIDTWLATDPRFGISRELCADYYMDWVSMTEATRWVEGANQFNQKFAWHSTIEGKVGYAELCAVNSNGVLLQPWNGRGKKGYLPVKSMPTTALFTEANATSFKRTRTAIEFQTPTELVLTYREQETFNSINPSLTSDPTALSYYEQGITIQSWARWRGQVPLYQDNAKLLHCTSRAQATLTAQIQFNKRRYSGRIASQLNAKTIESISLKLGEYYRVLTAATQYQLERSGMVIEVVGTEFRLDRDFTICAGISQGGIGGLTDGTKDFVLAGVAVGDVVLNIETNTFSTVTGVAIKQLFCVPPIPADTHYRIYDLSSSNMSLFVYGQTVDAPVTAFNWRVDASGHYWYSIGSNPNVGDIVLIGKNQNYDRLFQSVAITRSVRQEGDKIGEASVEIVGTNVTPKLFEFDDLVVTNRNEDINTPP